jgi:hypothetical protein
LRFSFHDLPHGTPPLPGRRVLYDVGRGEAWAGEVGLDERALVWRLGGDDDGAALAVDVELDPAVDWIVRCDRVDFPPGGVAYRHDHPGPGIRCLLFGSLRLEGPDGVTAEIRPSEPWFEGARHPIVATASETEETAFVRVLLLPAEWAGRRTIRYLDPADDELPRLQRATVLLEEPL